MSDTLLYGKANIKRIVGLECMEDGNAELFIQREDNSGIDSRIVPAPYWILASTPLNKKFSKLEGNLHYKYGIQFKSKSEFSKWSNIWRDQDTYKIWNGEEAVMVHKGYCFYQGMKMNELSLLSFDLETTGLDGYLKDAKILLISTTFRDSQGEIYRHLFSYDEYENEKDMIEDFCLYVRECNPSLVIGHNIISYDFLYLKSRAEVVGAKLIMGRDDSEVHFNKNDSKFRLDGTRELLYKNVKIYGRSIVDTYFLAVKTDVSKEYETYALKPLIKQLGFEKEGRQYYDAGSIRDHYKDAVEWEKIKQYAIEDADDSIKLFDHMAGPMFYWCQNVPKPFSQILLSATGSQINSMLVRSYLQEGHSIPKADAIEHFSGAISYGKPGIYSNAIRWDVSSLYPSIILTYNICNYEKDPNGNFLKICKVLTEQRLKNKKLAKTSKYHDDLQNSQKIGINSMYGFMGAPGLNFNSLKHAEMITTYGREILTKAIKWATGKDFKELSQHNFDDKLEEIEE